MNLLVLNIFLLNLTLIYGQNGKQILEYVEKQYSKLVKTVVTGAEYPTYGNPLQEKWLSTEPKVGLKFEQGMYPGVLWYLYNYTGSDQWKQLAIKATDGLYDGQYLNKTHDIGFIIVNSYGNGYQFTKNESYPKIIAKAAETLAMRYSRKSL